MIFSDFNRNAISNVSKVEKKRNFSCDESVVNLRHRTRRPAIGRRDKRRNVKDLRWAIGKKEIEG